MNRPSDPGKEKFDTKGNPLRNVLRFAAAWLVLVVLAVFWNLAFPSDGVFGTIGGNLGAAALAATVAVFLWYLVLEIRTDAWLFRVDRKAFWRMVATTAIATIVVVAIRGERSSAAQIDALDCRLGASRDPEFELLGSVSLDEGPTHSSPSNYVHVVFWNYDGADVVRLSGIPRPALLVSEGTEAARRMQTALADLQCALGAPVPIGDSSSVVNLVAGTSLETFRFPVGDEDLFFPSDTAEGPLRGFEAFVRDLVEETEKAGRYREWKVAARADLSYWPRSRRRRPSLRYVPRPLRGFFPQSDFVGLKRDAPWLRFADVLTMEVSGLPFESCRIVRRRPGPDDPRIVLLRAGTPAADAFRALVERSLGSSFERPGGRSIAGSVRLVLSDGAREKAAVLVRVADRARVFALDLAEILASRAATATNASAAPNPHAETAEPDTHAKSAESAENPAGRAPSRPEGGSGEAEPPPFVASPPAP